MFCAKINNLLDFVMNMVKICISAGGNKSPCLRQKSKLSKLIARCVSLWRRWFAVKIFDRKSRNSSKPSYERKR